MKTPEISAAPGASTYSLHEGEHVIQTLVLENKYTWGSVGIQSVNFVGVGLEHPQVSSCHCLFGNVGVVTEGSQ